MNFSKALDSFLQRKSRDLAISKGAISPRTMETYRYRLEDFMRFVLSQRFDETTIESSRQSPEVFEKLLNQIEVESITADDIANYIFECQQAGIAPPTINARLYTLRSFWKELSKNNRDINNVTIEIPRARYRYQRKPSVTRDHLNQFITHLKSEQNLNRNSFRNYILFNTIRLFGLRISEALNLTLKSLHVLDDSIKLEIVGKGNKFRVRILPLYTNDKEPIPVAHEFRSDLKKYIEEVRLQYKALPGNDNYLFLSQAGNRWNEDSARIAFNKSMEACQLQMHHYTPHSLRHAFVSHKLADGVPLQTVSRLVDHANVSITSTIYAHSEEQDLIEGMSKGLDLNKNSSDD